MSLSLRAFPAVQVGHKSVHVAMDAPVAELMDETGQRMIVEWSQLDLGPLAPRTRVFPGGRALWIHYYVRSDDVRDAGLASLLNRCPAPAIKISPAGNLTTIRSTTGLAIGASDTSLWTAEYTGPSGGENSFGTVLHQWSEDGGHASSFLPGRILVIHESQDNVVALAQREGEIPHYYTLKYNSTGEGFSDLVALEQAGPEQRVARQPWLESSDGDPVVATDVLFAQKSQGWKLASLTEAEQKLGIDALTAMLSSTPGFNKHFDGPPQARGHWPKVEIVCRAESVEHSSERRFRVFDVAGRIIVQPYRDVQLMEEWADLA